MSMSMADQITETLEQPTKALDSELTVSVSVGPGLGLEDISSNFN